MNTGILVYCIANTIDENTFNIYGLDGINKLYLINNENLYAIVSDVDLDEYSEEKMAGKGEDINWLKEKATDFMNVILEINSVIDIIPMKFLTIFTDSEHVKNMISDNSKLFAETFVKIIGNEEMSVKIYCDLKKYKDSCMDEEIKNFEKILVGKSKGAAFFLKKKFESELDDKIQAKVYKIVNGIIDKVSAVAAETKSNKILAKEITGINIPMISNYAFLIKKENKELFKEQIDVSISDYEKSGLTIEMTGPWPPYSFC
ncbi:MAG: hypothetical protein A2Y17_00780 [Clostridiales bacterium GWF2_38_85]|nr:MAG: hypothetical protein A2Y17_00780 [Clostridiales bacterium GWF2_38_85]